MGRVFLSLIGIGALTLLLIPIKHLANNANNKLQDSLFGKAVNVDDLQIGDHIVVNRGSYEHHGIFIGNDIIIHYSGPTNDKNDAIVSQTTYDNFEAGGEVHIVQHSNFPEKTIAIAKMCLGNKEYNLLENNCEHFANFCLTGRSVSNQVDNAFDRDYPIFL